MRIIGVFLLVLLGGLAYIRLAPIKATAFVVEQVPDAVGDYPDARGFTAVRPMEGDAADVLLKFKTAMLELPSTIVVSDDPLTFVTRSKVFGFPDVTIAVVRDGLLIVRGRLVYGVNDLGVNRARILHALNTLS